MLPPDHSKLGSLYEGSITYARLSCKENRAKRTQILARRPGQRRNRFNRNYLGVWAGQARSCKSHP